MGLSRCPSLPGRVDVMTMSLRARSSNCVMRGSVFRFACWLFWVRNNVQDHVDVVFDDEVETPIAVHSSLPTVFGLIVFLGAQ